MAGCRNCDGSQLRTWVRSLPVHMASMWQSANRRAGIGSCRPDASEVSTMTSFAPDVPAQSHKQGSSVKHQKHSGFQLETVADPVRRMHEMAQTLARTEYVRSAICALC